MKLDDGKPEEQEEEHRKDENLVRFQSLLDKRRQQIKTEKEQQLLEDKSVVEDDGDDFANEPRPLRCEYDYVGDYNDNNGLS